MFIAINKNGERVNIDSAIQGEEYFCPICHARLILKARNSISVAPHFAHLKCTCKDDWKYDMSEWHRNWQARFPENTQECVLTNNGETHRADVLLNNTVFEFQHSPLSCEEFMKRNLFYSNLGYNIVWVFDATNKLKSPEELFEPIDRYNYIIYKEDQNIGRHFKWKRSPSVFKSLTQQNIQKLFIFLEIIPDNKGIPILVPLISANPNNSIAYFLVKPITIPNFLKQFSLITDDTVESIGDIFNATKKVCSQLIIKQQKSKSLKFGYFPKKTYARKSSRL